MRDKIESALAVITFSALAALYPAIIAGGIVWTVTSQNTYALLTVLASYPVFFWLSVIACVWVAATITETLEGATKSGKNLRPRESRVSRYFLNTIRVPEVEDEINRR